MPMRLPGDAHDDRRYVRWPGAGPCHGASRRKLHQPIWFGHVVPLAIAGTRLTGCIGFSGVTDSMATNSSALHRWMTLRKPQCARAWRELAAKRVRGQYSLPTPLRDALHMIGDHH